jgi:hypothetical protein
MPGEQNYLRMGHTFDDIRLTVAAGKPQQVAFVLDKQTGVIETVRKPG